MKPVIRSLMVLTFVVVLVVVALSACLPHHVPGRHVPPHPGVPLP